MSQGNVNSISTAATLIAEDYGELEPFVRAKFIEPADIEAVKLLVELAAKSQPISPGTYAWVGMCLGLRSVRDGHTCIDFERIGDWLVSEEAAKADSRPWSEAPDLWLSQLRQLSPLVGVPGERKPFLLDGSRLYVARTLDEEIAIAKAVKARVHSGTMRVLMGGPGTGKTTKIATDLAARFQNAIDTHTPLPRLALAAPTGKAAARMSEEIRKALDQAQASELVKKELTKEPARTLHQLLGFNPQSDGRRYRWHAGSPLPYDLVIVDETSMISSNLMYRLLSALSPTAMLQLVGDPDQLASVDAGSVLGDLAKALERVPDSVACCEVLHQVYRTESRQIIELASAIKHAETERVLEMLGDTSNQAVRWVDPSKTQSMAAVIGEAVDLARRVCEVAENDPAAALEERQKFQVLCAHRAGRLGVSGWNTLIERRLGIMPQDLWYIGRPVMATRNNRSLRLANGDAGVVAIQAGTKAAFFGEPASPHRVPVARLEDIVTVHALTIHKSQGSEYGHVVVVLPDRPSRVVTRELLYTAVTRARQSVTIIGSREVLTAAVTTPIRRATGLAKRIRDMPTGRD